MKKSFLIIALCASFVLGFAFNNFIRKPAEEPKPKKVTGIGGVFFKCKDPKMMKEWYTTHLGMPTDQYGTMFQWREGFDSTRRGFTQWSLFKETTNYFLPSTKDFMINYRVEDMASLVKDLKKEGVTITDTIQTVDFGKFLHIMDPEGNKIELWEPIDTAYDNLVKAKKK